MRTHIRVLEEPTEVLRMEWLGVQVRRKGLPVGGAVLRWEEVSCISVEGVGVCLAQSCNRLVPNKYAEVYINSKLIA